MPLENPHPFTSSHQKCCAPGRSREKCGWLVTDERRAVSYGSRKGPAHLRFRYLTRIRRVTRLELGATAAPSRASGMSAPVDQNAIHVIESEHTMVNGMVRI